MTIKKGAGKQEVYLVADIGGTNARFALARADENGGFSVSNVQRYRNEDFAQLHDAASAFLQTCPAQKPRRGCFAIAGPVEPGEIRLTNSTWRLDTDLLADELQMERLCAVNDFAAQARGAPLTPPGDLVRVRKGVSHPTATQVVLGPGTGLGLGLLIRTGNDPQVVSTEGGHTSFSPSSELETAVWRHLHREHGFVSWELLLSGRGLLNIRRALCAETGEKWFPVEPEEVTDGANDNPDNLCGRTVSLFCSALGVFAGNAALMAGARGGVFLGGGILPKIRHLLETSDFKLGFAQRGPMSHYMEDIPVWLVMSDTTPLMGAAALAKTKMSQ